MDEEISEKTVIQKVKEVIQNISADLLERERERRWRRIAGTMPDYDDALPVRPRLRERGDS
jgi:hypothetical protein